MATTEDIIGRYVKVNGTRTFYDEIGSGPPVVCIHTAGASSLLYQYALPLLADAGFRAIAPDLPGRCRSYPVDWDNPIKNLHDHAEFVHAFMQEVCGSEKPVVTGTSIGGNIVLDLVAHHSADLRAAIAMEAATRTPTFPDASEAMYPAWAPGWQPLLELNSVAVLARDTPPERVTELRWMHRNAQESAVGDATGWATHDVRGKFDDVQCPVLVIKGVDDAFVPDELVAETAKEIPQADVRSLEGFGHYPPFEDPERAVSLIVDFVSSSVPAA